MGRTEHGNLSEEERERRRFARISNHFFLRSSRFEADPEDEKMAGIVRDINLAGLAFLTCRAYKSGEVLELEIEFLGPRYAHPSQNGLLSNAAIVICGSVARVEPLEPSLFLTVVLFGEMEDEDRAMIRQAISYQQELEKS